MPSRSVPATAATTALPAPPRDPAAPVLAVELAILAALAAFVVHLHSTLNHDSALYLQCAQLVLSGRVPYVDFFDVNPPLVMYMAVPVVLVARLVGVAPTLAFQLMVAALVGVSWIEIRALLRRSAPALTASQAGAIEVAWLGVSVLLARLDTFGQREHLFLLLYVPFLLLRDLRGEGRGVPPALAAAIGVQAGLGLFLKPDFLVMAAVVEVVRLLASGGVRALRFRIEPELAAVLAVGVAYAAHWAFVPSGMREAFFGRWVPAILRGYDAYSVPTGRLVTMIRHDPQSRFAGLGLIAALVLGAGARSPVRRLVLGLAALAATSLAFFFHEHKNWHYHLSPFYAAGILSTGLAWVALDTRASRLVPWRRLRLGLVVPLVAGLGVAGLLVMFTLQGWRALPAPGALALADAIGRFTVPGDRVLVLSTSVTPAYPAILRSGREPGSRHLWTFELPFALYEQRSTDAARAAEGAADEKRFLAELTADIDRLHPRLIAINTFVPAQGCPPGFQLATYFERAGLLAHLAHDYVPRDGFADLHVYVREGS